MIEQKNIAAGAVAVHLTNAEEHRDASVRSTAELIATLMDARKPAGISFGDGQPALESAMKALACDVEGRGHLVRSHAWLARMATAAQITMVGDVGDCDPAYRATGVSNEGVVA